MSDTVLIKADLINEITRVIGLNQREAKEFVDMFFEEIGKSLEKHEDVKISGFGKYHIRYKSPRPGRNPKTGVEVTIEPRTVVTFKASAMLKKRVANATPV